MSGVTHSGSNEVLKNRVAELEVENSQLKAMMMQSKNPSYFTVLMFVCLYTHAQYSAQFTYFVVTTPQGLSCQVAKYVDDTTAFSISNNSCDCSLQKAADYLVSWTNVNGMLINTNNSKENGYLLR